MYLKNKRKDLKIIYYHWERSNKNYCIKKFFNNIIERQEYHFFVVVLYIKLSDKSVALLLQLLFFLFFKILYILVSHMKSFNSFLTIFLFFLMTSIRLYRSYKHLLTTDSVNWSSTVHRYSKKKRKLLLLIDVVF